MKPFFTVEQLNLSAHLVFCSTQVIEYVRKDYEGDVQIKVTSQGATEWYWVKCDTDRISFAGENYNGWEYVDHRKMEGYYSDVACRLN